MNALGRNPDKASAVVAAEVAALRKLGREMKACPPNDSAALRKVMLANASPEYKARLLKVFGEFKLSC